MIGSIIALTIIVVIGIIYRYYCENNSYEYSPVTTEASDDNQVIVTDMEETISTRQLALNTIRRANYLTSNSHV